METTNGLTAITMIIILSFALDRVVTALMFLLGFNKAWERRFPDPALVEDSKLRYQAERRSKLIYFAIAALLGLVVLAYFGNVRLLQAAGFKDANRFLDVLVTGLILVAGADRLAQLQPRFGENKSGAARKAEPIEITGKLTLEKE